MKTGLKWRIQNFRRGGERKQYASRLPSPRPKGSMGRNSGLGDGSPPAGLRDGAPVGDLGKVPQKLKAFKICAKGVGVGES